MQRFVWFLILAFLSGVLALGCGQSEEPKTKPSAPQATPAPKQGEMKEAGKQEPEKKVSQDEAAKPVKPKETQPGEAKPAAEKPGDEKN
jgi:hypothetical protein